MFRSVLKTKVSQRVVVAAQPLSTSAKITIELPKDSYSTHREYFSSFPLSKLSSYDVLPPYDKPTDS